MGIILKKNEIKNLKKSCEYFEGNEGTLALFCAFSDYSE